MAYNPSLYNPYLAGGLQFIDSISELEGYQMPPGSTSSPRFLRNSDHFAVKFFDLDGGTSIKLYSYKEVPQHTQSVPGTDMVTRADLEQFKAEIMEAIDGKRSLQPQQADQGRQCSPCDPRQPQSARPV